MRDKDIIKSILLLIVGVLIIGLIPSISIVPSGYTGVKTRFGQIQDDVIEEGFCMHSPLIESVKKVNNKQQEITFKDRVWGESAEQTVVYMENVTVTYRIEPEYSAWVYANVYDYKENALPTVLISSALKNAMVSLATKDVTNRSKIEPASVTTIQNALNEKYAGKQVITVVSVNVEQMDFEESYNAAIAAKSVAEMNAKTQQVNNQRSIDEANAVAQKAKIEAENEAEIKRIAAQAEADNKLINAKAEADSIKAVADAQAEANKKIAASLTPDLNEYEKIQKWDGQLSRVVGTESVITMGSAD